MAVPKIDADFAARQILAVFAKYKVTVAGVLRRHQFFEVRDSDFNGVSTRPSPRDGYSATSGTDTATSSRRMGGRPFIQS